MILGSLDLKSQTGETDSKTVEMNVLLQIKWVNYLTVYDLKGFELAFKEKIG